MKTHPLNVSYLVVGLAFLGISGSWALQESGAVRASDAQWLFPLTLVLAGGIGLVAFFARGASSRRRSGTAGTDTGPTETGGPTTGFWVGDDTGSEPFDTTTDENGEPR